MMWGIIRKFVWIRRKGNKYELERSKRISKKEKEEKKMKISKKEIKSIEKNRQLYESHQADDEYYNKEEYGD